MAWLSMGSGRKCWGNSVRDTLGAPRRTSDLLGDVTRVMTFGIFFWVTSSSRNQNVEAPVWSSCGGPPLRLPEHFSEVMNYVMMYLFIWKVRCNCLCALAALRIRGSSALYQPQLRQDEAGIEIFLVFHEPLWTALHLKCHQCLVSLVWEIQSHRISVYILRNGFREVR